MRCLIVDRNESSKKTLEALLKPYGFGIRTAETDVDALAECRKDMPDFVVVHDDDLPTSAASFLKKMRRQSGGQLPAVLVCANQVDAASLGGIVWAGASDFLMYPYDENILESKLRQIGVI